MSTAGATLTPAVATVGGMSLLSKIPAVVAYPVTVAKVAAEFVTFFTRDMRCSSSGHLAVGTSEGVRCFRCWREPYTDARERTRWRDPA